MSKKYILFHSGLLEVVFFFFLRLFPYVGVNNYQWQAKIILNLKMIFFKIFFNIFKILS